MNKKIIVAAILALFACQAFAQTERYYKYDEYGRVGNSEGWARRFAHNFVDGLMGAEYYEVYEEDDNATEQKSENKKKKKEKKNYRYYGPGHTPAGYIGINLLGTQQPPALPSDLPQKVGKGFEWGFAIGKWGYHATKHVGINTALYLTRSRYWFGDQKYLDYTMNERGEMVLTLTNSSINGCNPKQGYLRYWSFRVPVCLELSSSSSKGPFIAFGPELEYRFADVSKVDLYGQRKAEKVAKGVNVNPLGLNAVLRMGIDSFGVIARYSFTSLFNQNEPVETYPFMIGISTSF